MSAQHLRAALPSVPRVAVVLGSGLSSVEEGLTDPVVVPFADIPGLPAAGAPGHMGRFVYGHLKGVPVLLQSGRFHVYEGHPLEVVVSPVRLLAELGVESLVLTSAVGGIHPLLEPGDVVLLDDVLNLSFRSPLTGPVVGGEQRFPDMSAPFDEDLRSVVREAAAELRMELHEGSYACMLGPQYETAAEVRMLAKLGADVVGMSTVPEVIVASALGLRCVGLSLVTNRATGLGSERLSHEDVLEIGRTAGGAMGRLVARAATRMGASAAASTQSGATK